MANCANLTSGQKLSCYGTNNGGVNSMYVAVFQPGAITIPPTGSLLTSLPASITQVFKYELKNTGNVLTEQSTKDDNNRTSSIAQSFTAIVNSTSAAVMAEAMELVKGEIFLIIEQNNGDVKLMGAQFGTSTSFATSSGGALTDGTNITFTFTATEQFPAPSLSETAITALHALVQE